MAGPLISNSVYDMVSWAKMRAPNGDASQIAELLNQSNEMVNDMVWIEGNLPTGCRITQTTGLPITYNRQFNEPVQVSRGQTAQFDESCAIFENWAETDLDILKLWADQGTFLFHQVLRAMESITQSFSQCFWYGDTQVNPKQFLGMTPRYASTSNATAASAMNVISGGGVSSANASIWLLTQSPTSMHGIFPKGSASGIARDSDPEATVYGTNATSGATSGGGLGGTRLKVHQDRVQWKAGIALWDWRWCARGCNIDVNNLTAENAAADLVKMMVKLLYCMPSLNTPAVTSGNPMTSFAVPGRQSFYMNRTLRQMLHIQALNKASNQITFEEIAGQKVLVFQGIPIRNSDQLLNTEAAVS